jgi:ABC-type amino acid transport system permease subunit
MRSKGGIVDGNLEIKGAILLYTLAGLMITFAGFAAVLLGIRQAAGGHLSLLDRFLAKTVLTHVFMLTWGAVLPPLLTLYGLSEDAVWKVAAILFAIPMLAFLLTYSHRRQKATGQRPPRLVHAVFVIVGSAVVLAMLVYVLGGFQHAAAAYISALVLDFFTLAYAFVTALDVILSHGAPPADSTK